MFEIIVNQNIQKLFHSCINGDLSFQASEIVQLINDYRQALETRTPQSNEEDCNDYEVDEKDIRSWENAEETRL